MAASGCNDLSIDEFNICLLPRTAEEESAFSYKNAFDQNLLWPLEIVRYRAKELFFNFASRHIDNFSGRFDLFEKALGSSFSNNKLRFAQQTYLVSRLNPALIYEFGTGRSSYFWGELLRHSHLAWGRPKGMAVCIEQSPAWYDKLQFALPDLLRDYVEIRLEPMRAGWFGPYRGFYFDTPVPATIDLLYVDGPTKPVPCQAADSGNMCRLNADLVRFVQQGCRVKYAFTDHRWSNAPFFREHLDATHRIRTSRWWRSILIEEKG